MAQRRRSGRRQPARQAAPSPVFDPAQARRRRKPPGPPVIARGYLILAGLFLVAVLAGVLVNYWVSVKSPGDQPILRVNNRTFSWSEFVSILKSQKLGSEAFGGSFNAGVAPYQLMQTLAENELVRQAAVREGLRVTDELVRAEMTSRLLPDASSDPAADQTQVRRDFDVALSNYLAITQLSFGQYRDIVYADLLRNQLRERLGASIPQVQPQAFVHILRVRDLQKIDEIQKRLKSGEDFSRVARQLSDDEETRDEGGQVGWVPRLVYTEFDQMLFGIPEGGTSDLLQAPQGVYIVRLVERRDDKARLQAILLEDGKTARTVADRLEKGADFSELAAQASSDPELRARRGDLGLVGIGDRGGIFDGIIRGIPPNEPSDPQSTADGTVVLMVTDRTQALEVAEKNLGVLKTRALEAWLRREWDSSRVNYCPKSDTDCFSNVKVDRALVQAGDVSRTKFEQAATATAVARTRPQSPLGR